MSGHSNFISVNSMPNNPVNFGNVGNVGGVQPQENVQPQLQEIAEELPGTGAAQVSPGELARQLDVLLVQAPKASTKGIDAAGLKGQVRDLGLGKKDLQTVDKLIAAAAKALNAIDKFTGRELATAMTQKFDAEGNSEFVWDDKNPAGKAIQAALDAQAALSEKLVALINSKGIPAEGKDILESAAMTCDRRACELETLVMQFSVAVSKIQFGDVSTLDPAVKSRLDTKISALMGEKALSMHGNAEALAHMRERLAPLATRLDDFASNPDKSVTSAVFASMRRELSEAKAALGTLVRDGYPSGNGRVMPDKAFMDAAKGILAKVEERMANARQKLLQATLASYVDSLFAPPPELKFLDAKFRPLLRFVSPQAVKLARGKDEIRQAAMAYAKEPSAPNRAALEDAIADYNGDSLAVGAGNIAKGLFRTATGLLNDNAATFKVRIEKGISKLPENERAAITPELVAEFKAALTEYTMEPKQTGTFAAFFKNGATFKTQLAHFDDMIKTVERMGDEDFMTSKTFLGAFRGELAPSTLVEARAHGMRDGDVDPATEPSLVDGTKELGSGAMNTVTAVTFKNGDVKVFKPEAPGRASMEQAPYVYEGYGQNQLVSQLNMASQKTADALGLGDVMAKTSVGKLNGQYGIFMEMVKGTHLPNFVKNQEIPRGSIGRSGVQTLSYEDHAKVQGQLMRKCSRLDWLDGITGQGDRHNGNVYVNVRQDGTVDVKGIDNDTCFPEYRIGMSKYVVAGKHLSAFNSLLDTVALLYGEDNAEAARERLLTDPGVTLNKDGSYTLDADKFEAPELHFCLMYSFGMYSNHVPNVIDEDLYNQLQTLKDGPKRDEYIADLKTRLSQKAVDAAVMRLDDAIRRADELKAKGRVYSEADWNDRDKQRAVYNDPAERIPALEKQFGVRPRTNLKICEKIFEGIRCMTQGNYKRNLFDRSAKIGWFAEPNRPAGNA